MILSGLTIAAFKAWVWDNRRKIIFYTAVAIVAIFASRLLFCGSKPVQPVIDEQKMQTIKNADRSTIRKELQETIDANAEVVRTVDNRTTIAEINVVERNRIADEKVKQATDAVIAARQQGRDITSAELECLLTGNLCP